jgi:O-methyltransferase involved in polyketide biosynthesis
VAEGLLYYLTEAEVKALLTRLVERLPVGQLIFDTANHFYLRTQKTNPGISATGARMKWGIQRPDEIEQ